MATRWLQAAKWPSCTGPPPPPSHASFQDGTTPRLMPDGLDDDETEPTGESPSPNAAATARGMAEPRTVHAEPVGPEEDNRAAEPVAAHPAPASNTTTQHVFVPASPAAPRFGRLWAALGWSLRLAVLLGLVAGVALLAVWPVWQESRRIGVEVLPITVPAELAARGLTPEVAAARLVDAVEAMARTTTDNTRSRSSKDAFGPLPVFSVTPDRLTLRKLASLLREFRGAPAPRIAADVVLQGQDRLSLRLRVPGSGSFGAANGISVDDIDGLFTEAAPEVWRHTVPLLYAWHVAETEPREDAVRSKLVGLARDLRLPPAIEARVTVLFARSLVRSGRARDAIGTLEALQRREPDYPLLWNVKAQALADLGRPTEALEAQKQAVALEGTSVWSHISSAHLLMKLGRPAEALTDLQSARRLSPNSYDAVLLESAALLALGRNADALTQMVRLVEAKPDFPGANEVLGNALLANRRPQDAIDAYDREIARDPALTSVRIARANALRALRKFDEALATVDAVLEKSPYDGMAIMLRGWTLLDLGKADEGLAVFERLLKEKPTDIQAMYGRAMALVVLGRRSEAIGMLQKVVDLQPANRRAAADLARLRGAARPPPPASMAPAPGAAPARP